MAGAERSLAGLLAADPDGGRVAAARRVLGVAMGVLAACLILAPKPWQAQTGAGFFAPPGRTMAETILVAAWWASAANLVLCALLYATAGWWAGRVELARRRVPAIGAPGKGFLALLALAALLGGALRWNLVQGSLWWDELWSVKRAVVGFRAPSPDDPARLEFHAVRPHWTLWHYKKPTNHVLYNATARVSVSGWRLLRGAEAWEFDELALRLPSYLAALAAIVLIGVLVREWGFPRAGAAAAFLLAVHPWHIQHGAEARAYGFVVLLAILSCLWLGRGLRTGVWRYWILYGAAQWLLFWTHPFAVYLTLSLGLFGLCGLLAQPGRPRERLRAASRLAVANLAAGMLVLQVMAPNFAQVSLWTDVHDPEESRIRSTAALQRLAALTFTGLPRNVSRSEPDRERFPSLERLAERHPRTRSFVGWALPLLAAIGLVRLVSRRRPERWVALGLGLAVPITLALVVLQQQFFHLRFAIYGLVAAAVFLPVGWETVLQGLAARSRRAERIAVPAGLAAGLVAFQALVAPQTQILLRNPHAPIRDVVERLRREAGASPDAALRAGLGLGGSMPRLYDPWILELRTRDELEALCRRALREARPLLVFYGHPAENRARAPGAFRYLDDPAFFAPVARLDGITPRFTYRVLRYTGKPLW